MNNESNNEQYLDKFVTAKLLGHDDCRQGWVISVSPLRIRGQSGLEYVCEGTPTVVVNPPGQPAVVKKLEVIVLGCTGSGKSTAARVISKALRDAGFFVSLSDKDDMSVERYSKCIKALQGTQVHISCEQTKGLK